MEFGYRNRSAYDKDFFGGKFESLEGRFVAYNNGKLICTGEDPNETVSKAKEIGESYGIISIFEIASGDPFDILVRRMRFMGEEDREGKIREARAV